MAGRSIKIHDILLNAMHKMRPAHLVHNPMLFIVFILACMASMLLIKEINLAGDHVALYFQLTAWIWLTLFFSSFADSYAESKMHYHDEDEDDIKTNNHIKKLSSLNNLNDITKVKYHQVKSGNLHGHLMNF